MKFKHFFAVCFGLILINSSAFGGGVKTVRLGYFSNITHAQALLGVGESRFQKALGSQAKLEAVVFNAGPSAVEALIGNSVDIIYVGPSPAINAWVKAKGSVSIVAGATSGGARLIVRSGFEPKAAKELYGKKIATPQFGNTQDVAARTWVSANDMKTKEKGGTVEILPIKNADQLALFMRGHLDAAWAVEPWASRLVHEAKGKEFLDERSLWPKGKFTSTVILTTKKYIQENPEVVRKLVSEHVEITKWINAHPKEAALALNAELKKLTRTDMSLEIIQSAMSAIEFVHDPYSESLIRSADAAFRLGFVGRERPDLRGLVDLEVLNEILNNQKMPPVAEAKNK